MSHILATLAPEALAEAHRLVPGHGDELLAAMDTVFFLGVGTGVFLGFLFLFLVVISVTYVRDRRDRLACPNNCDGQEK